MKHQREDWPGARILASCVTSFLALLLLFAHVFRTGLRVDNTSLLLLVLFIAPWLLESIESFEGFGVKVKTRARLVTLGPDEAATVRNPEVVRGFELVQRGLRRDVRSSSFESLAMQALADLTVGNIRVDLAIELPSGSRLYPDAVIVGRKSTHLVEVKRLGAHQLRSALHRMEQMLESYTAGRECECVFGLLILDAEAAPDLDEFLSYVQPVVGVKVAVLDRESGRLRFVAGTLLD